MIRYNFQEIRERNPLPEYLMNRGVPLRRQGGWWVGKCPIHQEQNGYSFTVSEQSQKAWCRGACATERGGWDVVDCEERLGGGSRHDALQRLGAKESETPEDEAERLKRIEERCQRQERAETEKRRENKAKRARWPQLYVGRTHDLQEVADLRGIDYAGPWLAQELGHLRFARWRDQLAWVVGDRTAAAARRLDGKLWEHGTPHKSDTLPGSEKHPIGLTNSSLPVILIEGEADYLATLARLWQQGQHEAWQVVCMLGAGARLGRHATKLRDREVTIYAHGEKAGQDAADRWKDEATFAGAKSVTVCALPDGQDVNDLTVKEEAA